MFRTLTFPLLVTGWTRTNKSSDSSKALEAQKPGWFSNGVAVVGTVLLSEEGGYWEPPPPPHQQTSLSHSRKQRPDPKRLLCFSQRENQTGFGTGWLRAKWVSHSPGWIRPGECDSSWNIPERVRRSPQTNHPVLKPRGNNSPLQSAACPVQPPLWIRFRGSRRTGHVHWCRCPWLMVNSLSCNANLWSLSQQDSKLSHVLNLQYDLVIVTMMTLFFFALLSNFYLKIFLWFHNFL